MSDKKDNDTSPPNYLGMSDEDLLNAGPPTIPETPVVSDEVVVEEKKEEPKSDEKVADADPDLDDDKQEEEKDDAKGSGDSKDPKAEDDETKKEEKPPVKEEPKTDDKGKEPPAKEAKEAKEEPVVIDYKAEYERLTAPFKANGREVKIDSVDDAIALMQMGANYNKQMAAFKPVRKLMKMLENSGFLSEEKISYLIDLGKKDPAAINKLVKEAGIDPMELDAEKATAYKPKTYAVDDTEIELDTVLDELQGSTTYTRTLDVVSNKWDAASKQEISKNPHLLKVLDTHVASGIYDLISNEVEKDRMLGRLSGLSDIQAYHQVGDRINARGGFNHLDKVKGVQKEPPVEIPAKEKGKPVVDDKLNEKRRAAAPSKAVAPVVEPSLSPLGMSDAEFAKLAQPKFK